VTVGDTAAGAVFGFIRLRTMSRYWTINGRFLTQEITGVQRYAREIVTALDDLVSEGHPLATQLNLELLAPVSNAALPQLRSIGTRQAGSLKGHLWEQFSLPRYARGGILSLCNSSTLWRRRQIVCIHDVNTVTFPQSYSMAFRAFYRLALPTIGRNAMLVATVSNYSREQLTRLGWVAATKLRVMPNGHEHVRRWKPQHSPVTKAAAGPGTIVLLGSLAPHKNINLLLNSAPELASYGFKLAIVGGVDRKVFHKAKVEAESIGVTRLGVVSDDELAALLKDCLCLAFPSLAEGFGLPPLEAMALGCPVVVSDRTSLPEVCGEAALYAPADNFHEWRACFLALRNNPALRNRQIAKGLARAEGYYWRTSAQLYLQAMADIDEMTSGVTTAKAEWVR
jgi:glycosyltransferase involved in cell wall biosynthesis